MQFKFAVALSLSHLSLVLGSPLVTSNEAIPGSAAKRDISLAIDKRTPVGPPACNINTPHYTGQALASAIQDGANYLNSLGGQVSVGSHQANRVSCSYASGVYVVNNGPSSVAIDYTWIGGFVNDILNTCTHDDGYVNGQEADSGEYVVVVAAADC